MRETWVRFLGLMLVWMDEDFVPFTLLGAGFCCIPLCSVGVCFGGPLSYTGVILSSCNLLFSFFGCVNSNVSFRPNLVLLRGGPSKESVPFLLLWTLSLLWHVRVGHFGAHCLLVAPSSPWLLFSGIDLQISAQPKSQEALSADLTFSLCSLTHFAVLPRSFRPLWHPWTGICVAITQKDHSILCSLSLPSPGNCSGQETRLSCYPSCFPSRQQPWCCATHGPVSKKCFIFVCFFSFLSYLKQEVNLVHYGCKQKSVFTFESEFQGLVLEEKKIIYC